MDIDLELYKIFFVVAETGSITKASEALHISQPAITKHIKSLESALGTPLFIRTKRGVTLNEYGSKMYLKVKQALALLSDASKDASEDVVLSRGTIKVGISTTLTKKFLLKYIEIFHNMYPNVVFDIYTDPTKELVEKLKRGEIDFIIGKFKEHRDLDLNYETLGSTEYVFVANPEYYKIDGPVRIEELMYYPILLQKSPSNSSEHAHRYFKDNNLKIEPKMNIASSNLLIDFVKVGYGLGYVTKLYVENELESGTLSVVEVIPKSDKIDYGIITLKNNVDTPQCKKFFELIRKNL